MRTATIRVVVASILRSAGLFSAGAFAALLIQQQRASPQSLVAAERRVRAADRALQGADLYWAVKQDQVETVRRLLDRGADPNSLTLDSQDGPPGRPLDDAMRAPLARATAEVADLLIAHGADANIRDGMGKTPILYADAPTARVLLAHGAAVDATTERGSTALCFAIRSHRTELARLLLEHGANPNVLAPDESAESGYFGFRTVLLSWANAREAALLIRYGARVAARDSAGRTALA